MRKPEQSSEPSIEEILASIRRVIADDGTQTRPEAAGQTYPPQAERRPQPGHHGDAGAGRLPHGDRLSGHYHAEPLEPAEPRDNPELLELTEDFMLEEGQASPERPSNTHQDPSFGSDSGRPRPVQNQTGRDEFDEQGLQTVLSNVAAEVDRLAFSDHGDQHNRRTPLTDENAKQQQPAFYPSHAEIRPRPAPPRSEPQPRQEAVSDVTPPQRSAPVSPPQPPAPPKMHSRPVWSARHRENDGATQPPPPNADDADSQSAPVKAENKARPRNPSGRDHWAEGVQMPVPESGPAMPFPYMPEETVKPDLSEAEEQVEAALPDDDDDDGAADQEKRFIGGFLTRVFGQSSSDKDEKEEPDNAAPESKAQTLAKSTIADFASDKLNAPAIAGALHADKPFMKEITGSLEMALAEAEKAEDSVLDMRSNTAERDEFLDIPPPPDTEFLPSDSHLEDHQDRPSAEEMLLSGQTMPLMGERRLPANLEDSIKEMVKPLIVQWLNENLARIVEKAVREEVAERVSPELRAKTGGYR